MGGRVGGGPPLAFDHAALEVDDDDVGGCHPLVGDAAGLDRDQLGLAVDAAGVAPGERHQSTLRQREVRGEALAAQCVKRGHDPISSYSSSSSAANRRQLPACWPSFSTK